MKILLADDSEEFRRYFSFLLKEKMDSIEFIEAGNGLEAIKLAEEFQPDLIFLDITMPELNGIEAAQFIHRVMPDSKIILLTVHMERTFVDIAQQAGASGYLIKNLVDEELAIAVEKVNQNEWFESAAMKDVQ